MTDLKSSEPLPTASALQVLVPDDARLEDLFNTDPADLSDAEINEIIAGYEAKASAWAKDEAEGKKQAKQPALTGTASEILMKLGLKK